MVLQASDAQDITLTAIEVQSARALADEIFLTEAQIRRAGRRHRFDTVYNAQILGNPAGDPSDDEKLTPVQIEYRDYFVDADYVVTLDPDTSWWKFDWASVGPEQSSVIYSIRTTVTPGAVADDTMDLIEEFFAGQNPVVTARVSIVEINGGDIDESDFGATASVFYEYTAVVTQTQQQDTDFSADLTSYLETQGAPLGYAAGNVQAYRISG